MRKESSLDRPSRISSGTGVIPVQFQGAVAAFAADDPVMLAFALDRLDDKPTCSGIFLRRSIKPRFAQSWFFSFGWK
jgi:hypothetical protein